MSARAALEDRLASQGFALPPVPVPNGQYLLSRRAGSLLYVAGQTPTRNGVVVTQGTVGADVTLEEARAAASVCALNALAIAVDAVDGEVGRLGLVRLVGFVRCIDAFSQQPQVIDGASETFHLALGDRGRHVRTAVGTHALPRHAAVEIETTFEIRL